MHPCLLALLFTAADPTGLRLEDATFRQFEDGPPYLQAFRPGEQVFVDLRIAGYARTEGENPALKLKWTFRATDAQGRLLAAPAPGTLETGLAAQDTEYRPRARFAVNVPLFALEGAYRVEASVTDEVSQLSATATYPFRVRGKALPPDSPVGAGNIRFFRQEEDPQPLTLPAYRPGAQVWMRFDLQGFQLASDYAFHVNYGLLVTGPDGKQFLKQDPAAAEQGKPFYPQHYVPATFVIQLPPKALPGDYRVALIVRDLTSGQEHTTPVVFRVE